MIHRWKAHDLEITNFEYHDDLSPSGEIIERCYYCGV